MLTHIVWWTFKAEALGRPAPENAAMVKDRLEALRGRIPELKELQVSVAPLPSSTEQADLVLVTRHDDARGLSAYAAHPEHQKVVALLKEVVETRKAIDFEQ